MSSGLTHDLPWILGGAAVLATGGAALGVFGPAAAAGAAGAAGAGADAGTMAAAAGAGSAVGAAGTSSAIGITASEATAVGLGASSLYTLSQGAGKVNVPPTPMTPQANVDQQAADAAQQSRERAVGGLPSTVGTAGGQAGSMLNPSTLSNRSVLGG